MTRSRFKTLGAVLVLAAGLAGALPVAAGASTSLGATPLMTTLKDRAHAAIERRLTWLNTLVARTEGGSHLTTSDRSTLQSQLASAIDGLKALDSKIQGDSDLATLRTDIAQIVLGYRVYVLVTPKVHIVIAADRVSWIAARLDEIAAKLQAAVDRAKAKSTNVDAAQSALDDMKAKIATAKSAVGGVPGEVLPLTPAGYPGNRSTLLSARASLGTARDALVAARTDAATVVEDLRG